MISPSETAKIFDTNKKTIFHWTFLFSEFLSAEANPVKGNERKYTLDDICVFALVKNYWEENPDVEYIRILLNSESHKEEKYLNFSYWNLPIFQEFHSAIDGTWQHGIVIGGMSMYDRFSIARSYRFAGNKLLEVALKEGEPHELAYPVFFNYRHALEYYLKILAYEPGKELEDHSFRKLIQVIENKVKIASRFKRFLEEWAKIDDSATGFRYAGELPNWISDSEWWIDLNQMRFIMNQLFDGIENAIFDKKRS